MKRIKLSGKVVSGEGEGKEFLGLPWVKQQITEKIGLVPYSGTLNVKLSEESVKRKKLLQKAQAVKIYPAEGYCTGLVLKAFVGIFECAIVVPEVRGYAKDLLEIIASVNLREALQLEEGSKITVTVNL